MEGIEHKCGSLCDSWAVRVLHSERILLHLDPFCPPLSIEIMSLSCRHIASTTQLLLGHAAGNQQTESVYGNKFVNQDKST